MTYVNTTSLVKKESSRKSKYQMLMNDTNDNKSHNNISISTNKLNKNTQTTIVL